MTDARGEPLHIGAPVEGAVYGVGPLCRGRVVKLIGQAEQRNVQVEVEAIRRHAGASWERVGPRLGWATGAELELRG